MQIWLFFVPGAGGDGVANLLEHASNVTTIDGEYRWRIHRIVNEQVKFYAPTIDKLGCFRNRNRFNKTNNSLNAEYQTIVSNNLTTVVTSHDISLSWLAASDCLDILTADQVKVLIHTQNYKQSAINAALKNLLPSIADSCYNIDFDRFDFVLDIDQIQNNWNYVNNFCQQVELQLDPAHYQMYQSLINSDLQHVNLDQIEHYHANIDNNQVTYTKK
jgi:hypothetical protein